MRSGEPRLPAVRCIVWLGLEHRFMTRIAQEFDPVPIFPIRVVVLDGEKAHGTVLVIPHAVDYVKLRSLKRLASVLTPDVTVVRDERRCRGERSLHEFTIDDIGELVPVVIVIARDREISGLHGA